ncbi:MAG: S8 family serine peptidase [Acidobacteriota bacterium]
MKSFTLRISLGAALLILLTVVGALPTRSDNSQSRINERSEDRAGKRHARPGVKPLAYRSPGAAHKLMLPADDSQLEQRLSSSRSPRKSKKYGAYSLVEVSNAELNSLSATTLERAHLRDDLNLVLLKRGQIDTTGPEPIIGNDLRQPETTSRALHLVQLFGPPTTETVGLLTATGAKVVGYVPNNAYLMWTTRSQRARLHALQQGADGSAIVQWDGPYHPAYKLDSHIKLDSVEQISASIQILDTPESNNTAALVNSLASKVLMPEFRASGAVNIKVLIESYKLRELAKSADVVAIGRWSPMKLMDERADQIVAGALAFDTVNNIQVSRPTGPGFQAFLNSVGFNSTFDFSIDIGDTGLDQGSADPARLHPDFLDAAGASRVAYLHDFTQDSHPGDPTILPTHDALGHGTINASILGGFSNKSGSAFADAQGFQYGLGTAPFARIGVSKLFPDSRSSSSFSYTQFIAEAYRAGARMSNDSWGACDSDFCNYYSDDAQVFDSLVRDADTIAPGNQSMTILFASGNEGDTNTTSVSIPGTAKNVITVGISENVRGTETDRCGLTALDADNAQDIVFFSGYGPVQDGRTKPDLVAPGSHMQGAASQDKLYAGNGVCDRYFPLGQTLYTWSSGTSHSTPVVTGAAALAFQWLRTTLGPEPSPALVKAFILNSTSYINGKFANDDLPGAHQGWGLLNIGRMFEPTNRIIYDESPSRTFTESGGAPFQTTGVIADTSKELRVMLVWTDPPGNSVTNAPYVNQLNLEVIVGGVVYNGNRFSGQYSTQGGQKDFTNNVQGVRLPAGLTGPFAIRVRPTVIAGDGVPGDFNPLDQDFALVVTNGLETAIPVLAIDPAGDVAAGVTIQHADGKTDASLIAGESAKITVTVRNQSQTTAADIQSGALSLASGNQSSSAFNAIAPGQTGTNATAFQIQVPSNLRCGSVANLQLQLDTTAGRFTLSVRAQVGRPSQPGGPAERLLFDDIDNGGVKWKKKGGFDAHQGPAHSGNMTYHAEDPGKERNDSQLSQLFMKKVVTIPDNAGQVRLSFFHIYNFEPGFDGGVLELSTDEGASWQDAGSLILVGGYDGKVTAASNNPLGTRFAWTSRGKPGVFSQVVVDLSGFTGKRVKLRFLAGFDDSSGVLNGYTGWFIDDIQVSAVMYSCTQAQSESEPAAAAENHRSSRSLRRGIQRIE